VRWIQRRVDLEYSAPRPRRNQATSRAFGLGRRMIAQRYADFEPLANVGCSAKIRLTTCCARPKTVGVVLYRLWRAAFRARCSAKI
jgi:hypothetical protein